jgi:hypothetical protein
MWHEACCGSHAMKSINILDLEQVAGGMKWQHLRESYNVEDRRPGAPPLWQQPIRTWWHNVKKGYLY